MAVAALGGLVAGASLAGAESQPPDRSPHLLLVPDTARAEAALARSSARTIARYDAFTLVEARGEEDAALRGAGADRRDDMRKVGMPGGEFDPLRDRESLADKGAAEPDEALAVVQFEGPVKDAWLERLRDTGVRVVQYMAQNGYLVHASAGEVDRLAALVGTDPTVRTVTRVTSSDKLSPALGTGAGALLVAVQTLAGADGADARGVVAAAGRSVRSTSTVAGLTTQFVALSGAEVSALAADPAVVSITPYSAPGLLDERSAQIVAGNLTAGLPTGPGYLDWLNSKGFGGGTLPVTIDVTDTGFDNGSAGAPGHGDFYTNGDMASGVSRVAYAHDWTGDGSARDCGGHGTNVASIAAGFGAGTGPARVDAAGFRYGMGAAPRVQLGASKIFDCDGNFELSHPGGFAGIAAEAYAAGARISNNSWGYQTQLGPYTPDAQVFDSLVRDAQPSVSGHQQMVEVFASGNEGGRGSATVTAPGTAKNVITVGASESHRQTGTITCGVDDGGADKPGDVIDFSSRGPTDDGRLKPDVVAPGTRLVGAAPQTGGLYEGFGVCQKFFPAGNTFYSLESGTSQAAPAVSSAAALIRSWYRRVHGGNTLVPSPALTKAILVDSATDLAGGDNGKGDAIAGAPNADQGWGRAHLGGALDATQREYLDQTDVLDTSGARFASSYAVDNPGRPLKVTLAWTDAPGMVGTNAFVNDLNLVVRQGGRTYKGNVLAGGRSITGGQADPRNNLESVVLPNASGSFSVEVLGANIAADGLPGNADPTDQDFALVVSNANAQPAAPVIASEKVVIEDPAPGDSDGSLEPGERFRLKLDLHNGGDADAAGVSGTLSAGDLSVSQDGADWPDIGMTETATNPTPFEATLSPTATCGVDVPATVTLATSQGTQMVSASIPTGAASSPLTHLSSSPLLPIPDDSSAGVTSTINVRTPGRVKDVDVRIASVIHSYVGDLVIDLTSPEGTTVRLADHPGGPDNSGDHLINTVFDDEAAVGISSGAAPYTGSFRPQNDQLSRFDGQQRQGAWRLRVRDLSEGDTGTLTDWQMVTQRAVCNLQDPHAPETSLTSGPPGATASRIASFGFASSEAGSSFECSLDGAPVVECESPYTLAGMSEGTHTFRVQARDQPGNLDPSPAEHTWRVDATAPAVSLSTPRPGASLRDARPQLAGSGGVAAGDSETVTVKLWRGAAAAGASAQTLVVPRDAASGAWSTRPATLADGSWTARAEQTDAVGNTGVSAPVTFSVGAADNTAPDFAIVPAESDRADARAGRLTVLAGCGSACRVSAELRSAGRRPQVLGRALASLPARRSSAIKVKISRKGRSALRKASTLKAKLRVTVDAAGQPLRLDQALALREVDLRRVARKGLPFTGKCSEQCSIAANLLMRARDARRHGLRAPGSRPVLVAGDSAASSATSSRLVLRMRNASRKALLRARRVNLTMEARVSAPEAPGYRAAYRLTLRR